MAQTLRIQAKHILERLMYAHRFSTVFFNGVGGWMSLNDILKNRKSGQYNARIFDLREIFGKASIVQGNYEGDSYYRLNFPIDMIDLDNLKIVNKKQTALPL